MSKYKTVKVWNKVFGNRETVFDYAGSEMRKSACGDPHSAYHPTLDHIRPLSLGGSDVAGNIVICHRDTNAEKADKFPHWKTNSQLFRADRIKGTRTDYEIIKL